MAEKHWFDSVHKALFRAITRREIARSVAMFLPGLLLSGATNAAAAKKRGKSKGKGNKKGKPKPKPKPAGSCSRGACHLHFVLDDSREYCEFICRQCDEDDPREFCIVDSPSPDPVKVAICCAEGAECCGAQCCGDPEIPDLKCCGGTCTRTDQDAENCGNCGNRCESGQVCRGGSCGCEDSNCGGCGDGPPCSAGEMCCGGACVNPNSSKDHCGGCSRPCSFWQECYSGLCRYCPPGQKLCPTEGNPGFTCVDENQTCPCPSGTTPCNRGCVREPEFCCGNTAACHPPQDCCLLPNGSYACTPPFPEVGYCSDPQATGAPS